MYSRRQELLGFLAPHPATLRGSTTPNDPSRLAIVGGDGTAPRMTTLKAWSLIYAGRHIVYLSRNLRTGPARPAPFASTLLARQPGFSLHAATRREANQRDKLEKLCRYITRPAIANERLSMNECGQVIHRFKQPFRDGSTQVVLDPLDFIARHADGTLSGWHGPRLLARYAAGGEPLADGELTAVA